NVAGIVIVAHPPRAIAHIAIIAIIECRAAGFEAQELPWLAVPGPGLHPELRRQLVDGDLSLPLERSEDQGKAVLIEREEGALEMIVMERGLPPQIDHESVPLAIESQQAAVVDRQGLLVDLGI